MEDDSEEDDLTEEETRIMVQALREMVLNDEMKKAGREREFHSGDIHAWRKEVSSSVENEEPLPLWATVILENKIKAKPEKILGALFGKQGTDKSYDKFKSGILLKILRVTAVDTAMSKGMKGDDLYEVAIKIMDQFGENTGKDSLKTSYHNSIIEGIKPDATSKIFIEMAYEEIMKK